MSSQRQILIDLHLKEFTGKVTLMKDQARKVVYFRKGNPIFVESNARSETLGQMLLGQGKIDKDQFLKTLEFMKKSGKRQGEALVKLGYLSGFEVFEALKFQGIRKFQNCFLMQSGAIEVEDGEEHLEEIPDIPIDFFRNLLDLFQSMFVTGGEEKLPQDKAFEISDDGKAHLEKYQLKPHEARLIRLLDGTMVFEQVMEEVRGDPDETVSFLLALKALSMLKMSDPPPTRFQRKATEVYHEPEEDPEAEKIPTETAEAPEKAADEAKKSSPLYQWILRMDRPLTDLLQVRATTTRFQIRKAYEKVVRDLHLGDIERSYDPSDHEMAHKLLDRLALAVTVLEDDKRRKEYIETLAQRLPPREPPPAIEAESSLQKALIYHQKRHFSAAEKEIRRAIELQPDEPDYRVALADNLIHQAVVKKQPFPDEIEKELKFAMSKSSSHPGVYYQMGIYHKLQSNPEKARDYFHRAVELKPDHAQASAELRLINQRLEKKKPESTFSKLFSKKK